MFISARNAFRARWMVKTLKHGIDECRSIEHAHADLLASYKQQPTRALARMIEQLEAEIAARKARSGPATYASARLSRSRRISTTYSIANLHRTDTA